MSGDITKWAHIGAGILFLVFAVLTWIKRDEAGEETNEAGVEEKGADKLSSNSGTFWRAVSHSFVVIFIAEWGDLTQLASASLAMRYHEPWTIFSASVLSLWLVTAIAVIAGNRVSKLVRPRTLNRVAAGAFAMVGFYLIAREALP
jgi:putative Ca2+/H+ antiporter (TMEM165/GDT1 family)